MWQPETPTPELESLLRHRQKWQRAFVREWCSLAEGKADESQVYDLTLELYPLQGTRDPREVAREAWGTPA